LIQGPKPLVGNLKYRKINDFNGQQGKKFAKPSCIFKKNTVSNEYKKAKIKKLLNA